MKKIFCTKVENEVFFVKKNPPLHRTKLHLGLWTREESGRRQKGEEKEKENWEEFEKCFGIEFGCEEDEDEEEEEEEEESPKRLQFWWICLMGFGFLEDLCLEMVAAAAAGGGGVAVVLVCTGMMRRKSTLMGKMRLVFLL